MIALISNYRWLYPAALDHIRDGDTIVVILDKGTNEYSRHVIRLAGIDCPEMDTPEGKLAAQEMISLVGNRPMVVQTIKTPKLSSREVADPYGRYLGILFVDDGNPLGLLNINVKLLDEALAVEYGPYGKLVGAMPDRQMIDQIKAIKEP